MTIFYIKIFFYRDSNKGLANQVFLSLYNKNIKHLKKSYITVSPMELLQRVSLRNEEHVEFYLKEMVRSLTVHIRFFFSR